jgi:hypothetical protein
MHLENLTLLNSILEIDCGVLTPDKDATRRWTEELHQHLNISLGLGSNEREHPFVENKIIQAFYPIAEQLRSRCSPGRLTLPAVDILSSHSFPRRYSSFPSRPQNVQYRSSKAARNPSERRVTLG